MQSSKLKKNGRILKKLLRKSKSWQRQNFQSKSIHIFCMAAIIRITLGDLYNKKLHKNIQATLLYYILLSTLGGLYTVYPFFFFSRSPYFCGWPSIHENNMAAKSANWSKFRTAQRLTRPYGLHVQYARVVTMYEYSIS